MTRVPSKDLVSFSSHVASGTGLIHDSAKPIELPTLIDLAADVNQLLQSTEVKVPNGVVYTNVASEDPAFGRHLIDDIYIKRTCKLSSVSLVALPGGATIMGGGDFILKVNDVLVREQYPVYFPYNHDYINNLISQARPVEDVTGEAIIAARFGIFTWGHWLGELLPKVVLAESIYPGRFFFVLPYQVLADPSPNLPWIRIRESLSAYGIEAHRIIAIHPDRDYRFSTLFAITPIWSDHLMHPDAMSLMRTKVQLPAGPPSRRRLAIERAPRYGRELVNYLEIRPLLHAADFEVLTTGAMPFVEQISLFNQADILFSILGSDLTNLIYSPDSVKVITAAPAVFGDRFFYALILGRNGQQIDLRGPVVAFDDEMTQKSTFRIDPTEVAKAIAIFTDVPQ